MGSHLATVDIDGKWGLLSCCAPFGGGEGKGELGPYLTNTMWPAPRHRFLRTKWHLGHLGPSSRLATIPRSTDRQDMDRQGRQRSDSIGRTVLETVAENGLRINMLFRMWVLHFWGLLRSNSLNTAKFRPHRGCQGQGRI